jgi:hypothetical protein
VNLNLVNGNLLKLKICAKADDNNPPAKPMTLIEVTLPSGYVFDESFKFDHKIRVRQVSLFLKQFD